MVSGVLVTTLAGIGAYAYYSAVTNVEDLAAGLTRQAVREADQRLHSLIVSAEGTVQIAGAQFAQFGGDGAQPERGQWLEDLIPAAQDLMRVNPGFGGMTFTFADTGETLKLTRRERGEMEKTFLPSANRGALNSMTNFCHCPGSLDALTAGGVLP